MQWLRQSREDPTDQKRMVVLCHPDMASVADEILSLETVAPYLVRGTVEWEKFEDGFPNLFIRRVEALRGREVVFLASFLNHSTLLEQLAVLYALPRYLVKSLILVLPYFPTGTMERVDEEGQIATAQTLARLLSTIPLAQTGPAKLVIYDIHALQNRFYFGDNVIPLLVSAIPLFVKRLQADHREEDIVIAFPDEGACKRFGKQFSSWETIICTKVREGTKRIVTLKEGDPTGKHVFIVDDLVKTGGTLIECREALRKRGAKCVSAFVTHAVFPLDSWKRFVDPPEDQGFAIFYITNSCPKMAELLKDKKPFRIISLAQSVADVLLKY